MDRITVTFYDFAEIYEKQLLIVKFHSFFVLLQLTTNFF